MNSLLFFMTYFAHMFLFKYDTQWNEKFYEDLYKILQIKAPLFHFFRGRYELNFQKNMFIKEHYFWYFFIV